MDNIFETLENNYIKFEDKLITVIIDNDNTTWFNANDTAKALGYSYPKDAINANVDKSDKIKLENINIDIMPEKHPHSIYLSESGLYSLMLLSRLPKAKKFKLWVTQNVLPSIRKFGYYKLKQKYEKEAENIFKKINELEKENIDMKNDLKKDKFPEGGLVYIVDYSENDKEIYRLGSTGDMNKRKKIYDTHTLHKKPVAYKQEAICPEQLEDCVRALLYSSRYKNRKDFFICKLSKIISAFKKCSKNIKCMNQTGGTNNINKIISLRMKLYNSNTIINKLNKLIN